MPNHRPVIFVHGLFGFGPDELGPLAYWGSAFKVPSPLPRFEASVGPINSAGTYYFAYITEQSSEGLISGRHYPDFRMNPALLGLSTYIGRKEFAYPPIPLADFRSADWWENDGMVPTYSQRYPFSNGNHPAGGEFDASTPASAFMPGQWYTGWERGMDHLDICITPQLIPLLIADFGLWIAPQGVTVRSGTPTNAESSTGNGITQFGRQRRFYRGLLERLAALT